ncbi:UNVERIFIED_CONTAM: hypothetical protein Scaly_2875600 [Sesamum calycinum]|uniref:Uncharacterized protein n=1 Tax=Sesamum calycinum TaxID=2727403 RepID=A0AAW2L823_9LAMI
MSTDHTEGQALKRRTGTSGINVFQFLALHRPSNGPWTKWPLPERTMSKGPPPPPQEHGNSIKIWQSGATRAQETAFSLSPGSEKSWFMEHRASSQREVKEKLNHKDRDCTDWADL